MESRTKIFEFLKPRIERVPNKTERLQVANDLAQRLGIDGSIEFRGFQEAILGQVKRINSLKSGSTLCSPEIGEAEAILIRILCSGSELVFTFLDENGQEQVYNPAEQAYYTLNSEQLHKGLRSEALIDAVLKGLAEGADLMTIPLSEEDRKLFMSVLMKDHEEPTADLLNGAIQALRYQQLERRVREIKAHIIEETRKGEDPVALARLTLEKQQLERNLRQLSPS